MSPMLVGKSMCYDRRHIIQNAQGCYKSTIVVVPLVPVSSLGYQAFLLSDKRNTNPGPSPIFDVFLPKEFDQQLLFLYTARLESAAGPYRCRRQLTVNPVSKEPPKYNRISRQTKSIPQNHLRAQSPPPEAKIAWMS